MQLREVLSSLPADERALKLQTREVFEAGVDALMDAKVPEAVLAFDGVVRANPRDLAAQALPKVEPPGRADWLELDRRRLRVA